MTSKDYEEYLKMYDVLPKQDKYYLRFLPNILYDTKEEAEKEAEEYKKLSILCG